MPPGDYTFTYEVSAGPNGPTETFTIVLTVPDPCENPTVTPADLSNVQVTITEAERTISPLFTVDPAFCAQPGGNTITIDPIAGLPFTTDPDNQILTIP